MAQCQATGIRIAGIASAVPALSVTGADPSLFGEDEAARISAGLGVQRRHIATDGICTSDLCQTAAEDLLARLDWDPSSIDGLIFVSQTPDYILPATSCALHARLGLAPTCAALDVNLGCSGFVYGLWLASQLTAGGLKRVLLLVGDTVSRIVAPADRSAAPLFGDAGTATALEHQQDAPPLSFVLGTDGRGWQHLQVPAGGFRQPRTSYQDASQTRQDHHLAMNGAEIFAFTLREVPPLVAQTLAAAGWTMDDVDYVVLHQANQMMLTHLAKKMKIPPDKFVVAMSQFGNTSSASIPLAVTDQLSQQLTSQAHRCLFVGFGVGLSWGAVAATCGPLVVPALRFLEPPATRLQPASGAA